MPELRIEQVEALRIEGSGRGQLLFMKQLHQRRAALPHDVADTIGAVWDREMFRLADTGGFPEGIGPSQPIAHGYGQALERCRDDAQEARRVRDAVIGSRRVQVLTRLLGPLDRVRKEPVGTITTPSGYVRSSTPSVRVGSSPLRTATLAT